MKNIKKFLSLGLAGVMALGLAACGTTSTTTDSSSSSTSTESTGSTAATTDTTSGDTTGVVGSGTGSARYDADGNRIIYIGTWWVQHYDSGDTSLDDSSDWTTNQIADGDSDATIAEKELNQKVAQLKFDNVTTIEEKYSLKFYWQNLTYTGVQESINTSILAGTPDCDIYLVDAGMAIPAQMNGLTTDLSTVLPADADVLTNQEVVSYVDLGDGKVSILRRTEAAHDVEATYPLGFNIQMLEENNLEDPRDLYERGEWTWDKFNEYCQILTQDTDGDGQTDQYGFCGYEYETFENLFMSNGANIAQGSTQTLDSAAVGEALEEFQTLYQNYSYPYDYEGSPSDSMRLQFTQGNIGFFPIAAWICSGNVTDDAYNYNASFDIAFVRWPVGPSGDQETNAGKNDTSGEWYIIPAGVEDPETVYNMLYDLWNWMDNDYSLRDDKATLNWWYKVTAKDEELQEENFNVMKDCGEHSTFDLWNSMSISYDLESVMKGDVTPAQFQETYKQMVQDGLDAYFG